MSVRCIDISTENDFHRDVADRGSDFLTPSIIKSYWEFRSWQSLAILSVILYFLLITLNTKGTIIMKPTDLKPPFDLAIATQKVRMAENAWNTRDPEKVSLAYTENSVWRNRSEHFQGRAAIVEFLTRKWQRELDYRLIKELWAFSDNRIGVRFQYEWHDENGQWNRSYGNELWEFSDEGLMRRREASINDISISENDRRFLWTAPGHRPDDHPGLIPSPE